MIVVLTDYIPVPRYDGHPWTGVAIEESADKVEWTEIDDILFSDPDTDPTNPKVRSFTTDNAALDFGWYRVVWKDQSGNLVPTDPVVSPPPPINEYMPTVEAMSALLRARTKDSTGNEVGVFTTDTTPDLAAVQQLIEVSSGIVGASIGSDIPDSLIGQAQTVVSWLTAMLIELSYFPEQVTMNRSAYQEYKALYDAAIGTAEEPGYLVLAVRGATDEELGMIGLPKPVGHFPKAVPLKW